ncbi:MAG: (Fe-S)-binding protein [Anaerolineae bacterium]|nr:(Fe-S)-binding protein [Anaerolineae bacterium]
MVQTQKRAALFVTCLVDQIMPEVGVAAVRLLKHAGYRVDFPEDQVCCGQIFSNSGYVKEAKRVARNTIKVFENHETVVMPSGSCAAMLIKEYPHLFHDEPRWEARAQALAAKTHELGEFLVNVAGWLPGPVENAPTVTYHDSCHANRMIGLGPESRKLLTAMGCKIIEMEESTRCCGFGGIFCVKAPEVSNAMTVEKVKRAVATGADMLVTVDPGCLMQMRGITAQGNGLYIRTEHLATVLQEAIR